MAVVEREDPLARMPRELAVGTRHPELRYALVPDLVATRAGDGPAIVQARGSTGDSDVVPVYRREPGGEMVVPTGRVLVVFADGERADGRQTELARAGYNVEQVLPYAPHAAWVRATNSDLADALGNVDQLARLHGVENVEPQMLGDLSRRF